MNGRDSATSAFVTALCGALLLGAAAADAASKDCAPVGGSDVGLLETETSFRIVLGEETPDGFVERELLQIYDRAAVAAWAHDAPRRWFVDVAAQPPEVFDEAAVELWLAVILAPFLDDERASSLQPMILPRIVYKTAVGNFVVALPAIGDEAMQDPLSWPFDATAVGVLGSGEYAHGTASYGWRAGELYLRPRPTSSREGLLAFAAKHALEPTAEPSRWRVAPFHEVQALAEARADADFGALFRDGSVNWLMEHVGDRAACASL